VIHEMRGEFSPLFYTMKAQLFAAETRIALGEVETAVGAHEHDLAEREFNRLKLLVARRWKAFG